MSTLIEVIQCRARVINYYKGPSAEKMDADSTASCMKTCGVARFAVININRSERPPVNILDAVFHHKTSIYAIY